MISRALLLALLALPLTACSSETSPAGTPDAAATPGIDAAPGAPDAAPGSPDAAPAALARLTGSITRSAAPSGDAAGHIYVALFDQDPIAHKDTAKVIGNALVMNANLAAAGAKVDYVVEGVTPRADDYFLIAFLDDNANVDQSMPAAAGPDKGDLVSLSGVSPPKVKLATAGDHTQNIDLNLVMPF